MRQFAGACRFVYNKALASQQERYQAGEKKLGYTGLCKMLTERRKSPQTPWLAGLHSQAGQQALKDLERAYVNFFEKRADFSRSKRRGERDGFRFAQGIRCDNGNARVFLPKLGWLRYRNSRDVPGEVRSATVSLRAGKWHISILIRREVVQPVPHGSAVGTLPDTHDGAPHAGERRFHVESTKAAAFSAMSTSLGHSQLSTDFVGKTVDNLRT